MSDDFFDRLTRVDGGSVRPTTCEEQELAAELLPALELLRSGAPENGVDLVPRWQRHLESEANETKTRRRPVIARYWQSAVLLLAGVALGAFASRAAVGVSGPTAAHPSTVDRCGYTSEQLHRFVALLDAPADQWPSRQTVGVTDLAACVGCHEAILRQRLPKAVR